VHSRRALSMLRAGCGWKQISVFFDSWWSAG